MCHSKNSIGNCVYEHIIPLVMINRKSTRTPNEIKLLNNRQATPDYLQLICESIHCPVEITQFVSYKQQYSN